MRRVIGMRFLSRVAIAAAFFLVIVTLLVASRILLQSQALSIEVLIAVAAVQLPHAAYLAAGLAAYWLVDELCTAGQLDLFEASGIAPRRIAAAILVPSIALAGMMTAYNTTLLRKMVSDLPGARARAELDNITELGSERKVVRVGHYRLGARAGHDGALSDAVLSVSTVVIESPQLRVNADELSSQKARLTSLSPVFSGTIESATVSLPGSAPLSWWPHLEHHPASTTRGVAFALDLLVFVIAALVCARRGAATRRLRWFGLWLAFAVTLLAVQNTVTVAVSNRLHLGLLFILAVPALALVAWTIAACRQRRGWL